ncbi:MAG: hypothetical protein WD768_16595 [Phycisphaeraceae bacterium]
MTISRLHHRFSPSVIAIVLLAIALPFINGCAKQGRWTRADYSVSYGLPLLERRTLSHPVIATDMENLSARIYLVADNQRHELLGNSVELFRTSGSDMHVSGSAIRPPQLDLFGQDLLTEALAMADGFVLHLGDACDNSNTGEFVRFPCDMRLARHGWAMAPGNHDGFFFGNSSRTIASLIKEWNNSAETYEAEGAKFASQAMQKDRYVSFYLASLILQDAVWSGPLATALGPECEKRFASWTRKGGAAGANTGAHSFVEFWNVLLNLQEEVYKAAELTGDQKHHEFVLPKELVRPGEPHIRRIAWQIDKRNVWKSFIVQEVDISEAPGATASATVSTPPAARPPISLLLLDSSQYGVQPSLDHALFSVFRTLLSFGMYEVQVAGLHGNILTSQENVVNGFMKTMKEEGRGWIVASHHPYADLGVASTSRFDRIRDAGGIPLTLSAHTHAGEIRWNHDGDHEGAWLEINVGSMLDAPPEFRDFQVHRIGNRIAVASRRQQMERVLRQRGLMEDDLPSLRPSPGDPDYYLNYQQGSWGTAADTDFAVKKILLAAYLRMFRHLEADDPDQTGTYWPDGPDGTRLRSHKEVTATAERVLAAAQPADGDKLTRFLYELREFDRTRKYTKAGLARLRTYRLSQAVWASRVELTTRKRHTPQVDPDLSFFILPPPLAK